MKLHCVAVFLTCLSYFFWIIYIIYSLFLQIFTFFRGNESFHFLVWDMTVYDYLELLIVTNCVTCHHPWNMTALKKLTSWLQFMLIPIGPYLGVDLYWAATCTSLEGPLNWGSTVKKILTYIEDPLLVINVTCDN